MHPAVSAKSASTAPRRGPVASRRSVQASQITAAQMPVSSSTSPTEPSKKSHSREMRRITGKITPPHSQFMAARLVRAVR